MDCTWIAGKPEVLLAAATESALSPGGQKGCFRSSAKCMNRMPKEFESVVVTRVYLFDQLEHETFQF